MARVVNTIFHTDKIMREKNVVLAQHFFAGNDFVFQFKCNFCGTFWDANKYGTNMKCPNKGKKVTIKHG
jgi:hypothetical protein